MNTVKMTVRWNSGLVEVFDGLEKDCERVIALESREIFDQAFTFTFGRRRLFVNFKFAERVTFEDE